MTVNSFRNLLAFGSIYCATQGALDTWDEALELLYLTAHGTSLSTVALAQTLGVLPMAVKGFLSLPSDALRLRRPFIVAGLLLSGVCFVLKTTFQPSTSFWAYCLLLVLRNTGAAIADSAGDGLLIDADVEELSGTISAYQGVGRMAGLITSSLLGGYIARSGSLASFDDSLVFLGGWLLVSSPVAWIVREELTPSTAGYDVLRLLATAWTLLTCGLGSLAVTASAGVFLALGMDGGPPTKIPPRLPERGKVRGRDVGYAVAPNMEDSITNSVSLPSSPVASGAPKSLGDEEGVAAEGGVVANPLAAIAGDQGAAAQGDGATSPKAPEAESESGDWRVLLAHCMRPTVTAFIAYMFFGQFATYIASFPVVPWLEDVHQFSVPDVTYITVVGALGNALGCYVGGLGYDRIPSKRVSMLIVSLLSGLPYFLFLVVQGQPLVYLSWTIIQVGYGALYTVQVSQIRLMADKRVSAAFSGVCMGMLAASAAVGTVLGGFLVEIAGYNMCYIVGASMCGAGIIFIPFISSLDPELIALKAHERAAKMKRQGKKGRRRKSFAAWVRGVKGDEAAEEIEEEDDAAEREGESELDRARRLAVSSGGNRAAALARSQGGMKKPTLGSMRNLLDPRLGEDSDSFGARARAALRGLFDDGRSSAPAPRRRATPQTVKSWAPGQSSPTGPPSPPPAGVWDSDAGVARQLEPSSPVAFGPGEEDGRAPEAKADDIGLTIEGEASHSAEAEAEVARQVRVAAMAARVVAMTARSQAAAERKQTI